MRLANVFSAFVLACSIHRSKSFGAKPKPSIEDDAEQDIVPTSPEAIALRDEQLTLASKVMPVMKQFVITGEKAKNIVRAIQDAVNEQEMFLLGLVAWGWFPLNKLIFEIVEQRKANAVPVEIGDETSEDSAGSISSNVDSLIEVRNFEEGVYWYQSAKHLAQAAKIGVFVYAVDCLAVIMNCMGFRYKQQAGFSKKAANISISVWAALRLGEFKRWLLQKAFNKEKNQMGKVKVYDSILNVVVGVITFGHILDLFDINIGVALASLLSIGGVGTLVLSLASKDVATELVSGLAIGGSDRFLPGEEVVLGDGTAGFISSSK